MFEVRTLKLTHAGGLSERGAAPLGSDERKNGTCLIGHVFLFFLILSLQAWAVIKQYFGFYKSVHAVLFLYYDHLGYIPIITIYLTN